MIDEGYKALSMRQQCKILGTGRSSVYYKPSLKQNGTLLANKVLDIWLKFSIFGYRKIAAELKRRGYLDLFI